MSSNDRSVSPAERNRAKCCLAQARNLRHPCRSLLERFDVRPSRCAGVGPSLLCDGSVSEEDFQKAFRWYSRHVEAQACRRAVDTSDPTQAVETPVDELADPDEAETASLVERPVPAPPLILKAYGALISAAMAPPRAA